MERRLDEHVALSTAYNYAGLIKTSRQNIVTTALQPILLSLAPVKNIRHAIAQYQAMPLLLEVYPTPSYESRDPNQPIANFRCISVAPEEPRFSGLPPIKSLSVIINSDFAISSGISLFYETPSSSIKNTQVDAESIRTLDSASSVKLLLRSFPPKMYAAIKLTTNHTPTYDFDELSLNVILQKTNGYVATIMGASRKRVLLHGARYFPPRYRNVGEFSSESTMDLKIKASSSQRPLETCWEKVENKIRESNTGKERTTKEEKKKKEGKLCAVDANPVSTPILSNGMSPEYEYSNLIHVKNSHLDATTMINEIQFLRQEQLGKEVQAGALASDFWSTLYKEIEYQGIKLNAELLLAPIGIPNRRPMYCIFTMYLINCIIEKRIIIDYNITGLLSGKFEVKYKQKGANLSFKRWTKNYSGDQLKFWEFELRPRFQSSVPVAQANKWSGTCPDGFWPFEYNSSAKMRLKNCKYVRNILLIFDNCVLGVQGRQLFLTVYLGLSEQNHIGNRSAVTVHTIIVGDFLNQKTYIKDQTIIVDMCHIIVFRINLPSPGLLSFIKQIYKCIFCTKTKKNRDRDNSRNA
ncbi:hypothetical protein WN51_02126 [Melipona quadrifasciata]|uniref:Uncharacterized protein n=1 Tax=Melipona quadrifasciata TaxID=166423 RepID=A0A0N0U3U2_9HYME|nr:hypothetical protein WN51_02126 [Melipona quadrifasciata]